MADATLRADTPSANATLRDAIPCDAIPCDATPCDATLRDATPRDATSRDDDTPSADEVVIPFGFGGPQELWLPCSAWEGLSADHLPLVAALTALGFAVFQLWVDGKPFVTTHVSTTRARRAIANGQPLTGEFVSVASLSAAVFLWSSDLSQLDVEAYNMCGVPTAFVSTPDMATTDRHGIAAAIAMAATNKRDIPAAVTATTSRSPDLIAVLSDDRSLGRLQMAIHNHVGGKFPNRSPSAAVMFPLSSRSLTLRRSYPHGHQYLELANLLASFVGLTYRLDVSSGVWRLRALPDGIWRSVFPDGSAPAYLEEVD
jgi:hypothetical protein